MESTICVKKILITDKLFRLLPDKASDSPRERAVVFVHGFLGNADDTWKAREARDSFPSLLATDPQLPDFDIFLFQYVTKDLHPPAIENIAGQLRFAIKEHLRNDSIIFLAHSMGGLVCMSYILSLLTGREKGIRLTGGLLLYGTPMSGIEWAKYARLVLKLFSFKLTPIGLIDRLVNANRQVEALTAGSEYIDRLNGNWVLRVLNGGHPEVPTEQRAWFPVRVVSGNDDWVVKESSARGFYSEIDWINTDKDHRELVKPKNRLEMTYQVASNFLRECREWMNPQSLLKLRRQIDDMADVHRRKCIADWQFQLSFDSDDCKVLPNGFALPGFRAFSVLCCSYKFLLTHNFLKFGFALGGIAAESIWSDDFVFLHSLRLGALADDLSNTIRQRIKEALGEGEESGWRRLFDDVVVRIRSSKEDRWYQLKAGALEKVADGLIRIFPVDSEAANLVGKEVVADVKFRALLPAAITDYTVSFPWLCDGFTVRIAIDGNPSYLVESQAMRGVPRLESKAEKQRAIETSSRDLILPGSYLRFEWGFKEAVPDESRR